MASSRNKKRNIRQYHKAVDGYADPGEVADFAAELPISHLHCRELGHNWKPWVARIAEDGGFERALRCTRCRAERWQSLTRGGSIVSSHYVYPDGYIHEGLGRIVGDGRDALRLESLTRALDEAERTQLKSA